MVRAARAQHRGRHDRRHDGCSSCAQSRFVHISSRGAYIVILPGNDYNMLNAITVLSPSSPPQLTTVPPRPAVEPTAAVIGGVYRRRHTEILCHGGEQ